MKRVFIAIVTIALLLTACGSKKPVETIPTETEPPTETVEKVTEPAVTVQTPTVSDEPTAEETEPTPSTDETIPETTENLIDGMRPAFKEAMDTYESFYNEYCDFLSKYAQNPTDFSLLGQYAGMLSKAGEMDAAFKKWDEDDLNSAELQYYLEVNSRVLQKLAGVMSK